MNRIVSFIFFILLAGFAQAQDASIQGRVMSDSVLAGITVRINGESAQTKTDENGRFLFAGLSAGHYDVVVQALGYLPKSVQVELSATETKQITIQVTSDRLNLGEVVVSGTRYETTRKESPVIVNVIGTKLFNATQSVAASETLNYSPGLRLENNCQNCGFTQVRMNGLEGAYSQILINSRPVFSALNGVYGLDQIPTSMVDRIEVVRGGGSALYGSNAIAGTINIITKDPVINSWEVRNNTGLIDGRSFDNNLSFNSSVVDESLSYGATFYGASRNREAFDANGDGFTEITRLKSNTFGSKLFYKFSDNNKLSIDFSAIQEERRGGDRLNLAPHFTDITEALDHKIFMGGVTFDQYSRDHQTKFSLYASAQHTGRDSYYGGLGGGRAREDSLMAANAYGITEDFALVGGGQLTHNFSNEDILTAGIEYNFSKVDDEIPGYNRSVEQRVSSMGLYAQYEWKPVETFKALLGGRFDQVRVDGRYALGSRERESDVRLSVFSPRLTLLYDLNDDFQLRGGYARGFRAPQAFDEDMHVSSVGGDQQFILIGEDLEAEFSNAYTASLNFSRVLASTQLNLLVEGFYTDLQNPFTYVSQGAVEENLRLEQMVNGEGAYVSGANMEIAVAPSDRLSFQLGGTLQQNRYRGDQELFEGEESPGGDPAVFTRTLVRAPNSYGYLNTNWQSGKDFSVDLTGTYTGSMIAPHVVRESGFMDLVQTPEFFELNIRLAKVFRMRESFALELSGGVQNAINSFQRDFDRGAKRDSDYIYGPARPRTFFLGLRIGNF